MQREDSATKSCYIATKFWCLVAKLRLDFFVNFEACTAYCGTNQLRLLIPRSHTPDLLNHTFRQLESDAVFGFEKEKSRNIFDISFQNT